MTDDVQGSDPREAALATARAWLLETKPNPNPARKPWILEQLRVLGVTDSEDLLLLFAERYAAFSRESRGIRRSSDPEFDCECPNCGEVFPVSMTVTT